MAAPDLSPEQQEVAERVEEFLTARNVPRAYFCIQGLAGTGKSVLLAAMAAAHPSSILCAPTGKAASVLSRRTGLVASTIHSAIYQFRGEFEDEETGEMRLNFKSRIADGAWKKKVAFLDESSMVDVQLATDFLNTGCRIVATGDPGQLPPVKGSRFFDTPDATLQTIHRQALDSAIIRQAHNMRANGTYAADGPDFRVVNQVSREEILAADVMLCWRNVTRQGLNALARAHRGFNGPPIEGEPIMCLRNDHDVGILNGAMYAAVKDYDPLRRVLVLMNERGERIHVQNCRFEGVDPPGDPRNPKEMREEHPFAFGYAATVHKFQGSEADHGILVDEYDRMDGRREFLYTGFTRFAKQVLVYRSWE